MDHNKKHWEDIYQNKTPDQVSWTQEKPILSLELIDKLKLSKSSAIIDVGAGDSNLVDYLLQEGYTNITVLDISEKAIKRAQQRLKDNANKITWVVSDVLDFQTDQIYDLWHDRAAFHFQCDDKSIHRYVELTNKLVKGHMIISTFSDKGPLKCSGLQIKQYDKDSLAFAFKDSFVLETSLTKDHITPFDTKQNFIYGVFKHQDLNTNNKTMQFNTDIAFDSERLHFQIVSEKFKQDIFEALTPTVAKFLPFIPADDLQGTQGFIDYSLGQLEKQQDITLIATDKQTGEFIGCCGIHDICQESISLGIWLKEAAFGKGYGQELIKALEDFVAKNLDVSYLIYNVEKDNSGSLKIAEKLGYVYNHSFVRNISEQKILNMLSYRKDNIKK